MGAMALRFSRRHADYSFLGIILVLLFAGLLILSSASAVLSQKNFGTPYHYLARQSVAALIGLGLMAIMQALPYRAWRKLALPLLLVSLLLMTVVALTPLGFSYGGARRWLHLGAISFQPSEILKFSLILYLASWLNSEKGRIRGFASGFVPFLIVISIVAIMLAMQPDIGTLIVVMGGAVILYFLGGGKISQLAALGILALIGLGAIVLVAPYRIQRLSVFLNPQGHTQDIGYHINQAMIAIGSGGFWGKGFGQGIQKYSYLPETIGDSVFAVIVEEFGFFGALLLGSLFLALFLRAVRIVRRAPDLFAKLVVVGFAAIITFQAFFNMAAISGLLPLTGIPLPFMSYGGTSLVVTLAMCGIILNVSKQTS